MEKILLAMNSQRVEVNAIRFACYLTRITHSKLTGIFLENLIVREQIAVSQMEEETIIMGSLEIMDPYIDEEEQENSRLENIQTFLEVAQQEGVLAYVDVELGTPVEEMFHKMRLADLLVIDAKTSFSTMYDEVPSRFVKDLIQEAECPVVIAPETFSEINDIVFCFDEIKSSYFAMKQFMYLFPEFKNRRAKLIYLDTGTESSAEEEQEITDWLGYHYTHVEPIALEADATQAFFNYLMKKKNDFIVMGAFGRDLLNTFFENEPGQETTRTTSLPIFVSHY